MEREEWKEIKGYEEYYLISDKGNVFSKRKNRIMSPTMNSKGYYRVELNDGNSNKRYFVHRLVAETFLEKPNDCDIVNHLDFNPQNNNVDNLEWTTRKGNMEHSASAGRFEKTGEWKDKIVNANRKHGKKVVATEIQTGKIIIFDCLNDCKQYGFLAGEVSRCCNGKRKTHRGYWFRFM